MGSEATIHVDDQKVDRLAMGVVEDFPKAHETTQGERFDQIDHRFNQIDRRFDRLEERLFRKPQQ